MRHEGALELGQTWWGKKLFDLECVSKKDPVRFVEISGMGNERNRSQRWLQNTLEIWKNWYRPSYLWSRNRVTDVENKYTDTKGEGGVVGRIERLGLYTLLILCVMWITSENILFSIWNSTQWSLVTYMGSKSKKRVDICICRLPQWFSGKESAWKAGDTGDEGSVTQSGRFPGGGHGNPLQYSCQEKSHGQRSLAGCGPWGCKESDMTEAIEYAHTSMCVADPLCCTIETNTKL